MDQDYVRARRTVACCISKLPFERAKPLQGEAGGNSNLDGPRWTIECDYGQIKMSARKQIPQLRRMYMQNRLDGGLEKALQYASIRSEIYIWRHSIAHLDWNLRYRDNFEVNNVREHTDEITQKKPFSLRNWSQQYFLLA